MSVEVGKSKERLDVFDFSWFGPLMDGLDFVFSHCETFGLQYITEEFDCVFVPFTFAGFSIESVFSKAS